MKKTCTKCKQEKEITEFPKRYKGNSYGSWCKKCISKYMKKYNKEYHQEHKEQIKKRKKKYHKEKRQELKEFVNLYKSERGCKICEEKFYPLLVFHHRNSNEKEFSIAKKTMLTENLIKEIEKCDVYCANCHRLLHWEERQIYKEDYLENPYLRGEKYA